MLRSVALFTVSALCAFGQVIEFESNGLKYQTLTKAGITVMFASIPSHIKGYTVLQVAVSNGSKYICTVEPEEFVFRRDDGTQEKALPARQVVKRMLEKASRDDVIRLVGAYELSLYGLQRMQSTNGYEQRRQTAIGEIGLPRSRPPPPPAPSRLCDPSCRPGSRRTVLSSTTSKKRLWVRVG